MLKKVCILGHFGEGLTLLNGQTIKTKIITEEFQKQLGKEQVLMIDTHGGFKSLFKAPFQVLRALKNTRNILILPAHNGLRVYAPLLYLLKRFFKNRTLHYIVIGGWLPQFISHRKCLAQILRNFDGIYVETNTMKETLETQHFSNIYTLPNCKNLTVLSEEELIYPSQTPYKLCTFSRVMKEKGIETAINTINSINNSLGQTFFSLDIYGQVDSNQVDWFENLKSQFPDYVNYCGYVDPNKSVEVLKHYFALIFPTHFYTEGVPGTIIDAYAAGLPVISAKWESYSDVIDDGSTGIGYDFNNDQQFANILLNVASNPKIILDMKTNCTNKAKKYLPSYVFQEIVKKLA